MQYKGKGGNRCLVPKNPTPSSYWSGPVNPAPPNKVPSQECQFSYFTPLVLSQFGGKKYKNKKTKKARSKNKKTKKARTKNKKYKYILYGKKKK